VRISDDLARARVCFLTGAGASMPLGLADTRRFIERLVQCDAIKRLAILDTTGTDIVGGLRNSVSNTPKLDIETVLTELDQRLEALERLQEDALLRKLVKGVDVRRLKASVTFLSDIREAIYDEVVATYGAVSTSGSFVLSIAIP